MPLDQADALEVQEHVGAEGDEPPGPLADADQFFQLLDEFAQILPLQLDLGGEVPVLDSSPC